MIFVVALAWGVIAAAPGVRLARRVSVAERVRPFRSGADATLIVPRASGRRVFGRSRVLVSIALVASAPHRRRLARRRDAVIGAELPVVVDILGVALAAGCTPYLAIEHAARYGPPAIAMMLDDVLQACNLGQSLDDALRDIGASQPRLRSLADALRTSARLGSPAAPALARLAAEVRADARRRAEARARTVPVRLCFPLVACVLPAFALLTVIPVVLDGFHA